MSKAINKLILWLWIGTTSLLDLSLVTLTLPTIARTNYFNNTVYALDSISKQPLYLLAIDRIGISLLFLLFGMVWAAIVLIASERLLVFLAFPTPGNNKFSRLSLTLFKLALAAIVFTILIGNISLIYDLFQGEVGIDRY
ncbi:hypothetical protein [Chamaesiphon sp. VAR_69_metabat_338]|uniref:hypothetical protein n=1 Tax=Chamaesiphon sp. VAR_69_metabat_338 TaxID=2964704 RepID=UPI00286E4285|nr:hypothetical protein [Chamaesiphon sp. VAR_69_metabat_338]